MPAGSSFLPREALQNSAGVFCQATNGQTSLLRRVVAYMSGQKKLARTPAVPSPSSSHILISPLDQVSQCGYNYRILMVRRNAKSSFKNATVFPGGNMDDEDHESSNFDKLNPTQNAYKRCAIRETFEETGILITHPRVKFDSGERRRWRDKVHESGKTFHSMLDLYGSSMHMEDLVYYANWITPAMLPRRYDTHFFISLVPSSETLPARHDNSETLEISHFTPVEAIAAHTKGEIVLFGPQLYMLHDMALSKTHQELLSAIQDRPIVPIQPMMNQKLGFIALPGDEERGGKVGARNRVHVKPTEGNLIPTQVVRRNVEGYRDMDSSDLAESVSLSISRGSKL